MCVQGSHNNNLVEIIVRLRVEDYILKVVPTPLLDTVTTIADKRANKTTKQHHAIVQSKLIRLQHAAHKKRHKTGSGIFLPVL